MKTAIISTEFWENDNIASLNTDTRSVYLCLLTNPKRNTTPIFKLSDRLLSFYSGYSQDVLKTCISQLEEKGFIRVVDGYYILIGQEYIKAKRGKLTKTIEDKYISTLPESVISVLENNDNSSSEALEQPLEYNNKDNNNNNNKDDKGVKNRFEVFRQLYKKELKGKAKSLDKEYANFKKKYPKLNTVEGIRNIEVQLGKYYMELKKQFDDGREDVFNYVPHLSTYINQARWEHYED